MNTATFGLASIPKNQCDTPVEPADWLQQFFGAVKRATESAATTLLVESTSPSWCPAAWPASLKRPHLDCIDFTRSAADAPSSESP